MGGAGQWVGPAPSPPGPPLGQGSCPVWGAAGYPVRGGLGSMLTHPLRAWGGEGGAEGMEVWCHPELTVTWGTSLVGYSPWGRKESEMTE